MNQEKWPGLKDCGFVPYADLVRWKQRAWIGWALVVVILIYIAGRGL